MLETTSLKTVVQEKPLVADSVEDYFNSVLRVYEFYRTKNPDAPVDEAFIFGRGGDLIDIGEFFEAQIDIPVTMLEKLVGVEREVGAAETDEEAAANDKRLFRYIDTLGSVYGTLDFVSKEMEGDRIARARNRVYFGAVMLAVVASAVLVLIPLVEVLNLRQDKGTKERELANVPDVTPIYNEYSNAYAKYKDIITFYDTTKTEAEALNNFIEELELIRPESSKIENLSCSAGGEVSMSVLADSWDTCAKFVMQLKAMSLVKDVSVSAITQSTGEGGKAVFSFSASCDITNDYIDPNVIIPETSKSGK
jgi:type IV pilus assembly protein PilM